MNSEKDIARALLKKLFLMGCWGKRHVCESNLPKGFPSHLKGRVKAVAEELRKRGLLVKRPSHHEHQWYLNFEKKNEIEELMH